MITKRAAPSSPLRRTTGEELHELKRTLVPWNFAPHRQRLRARHAATSLPGDALGSAAQAHLDAAGAARERYALDDLNAIAQQVTAVGEQLRALDTARERLEARLTSAEREYTSAREQQRKRLEEAR